MIHISQRRPVIILAFLVLGLCLLPSFAQGATLERAYGADRIETTKVVLGIEMC